MTPEMLADAPGTTVTKNELAPGTETEPSPELVPASDVPGADLPGEEGKSDRDVIFDGFSPAQLTWKNVDWTVGIYMVFVHLVALAAPFFFSWTALGVCLFLHWLTCSIGICLGYHRYLSHRSLKLKQPAKGAVLFSGVLAGEGPPLTWLATHRLHHQRSDQHGDPHSPLVGNFWTGAFWSHIMWLFVKRPQETQNKLFARYAPEFKDDKSMLWLERYYGLTLILAGVVMAGIGFLVDGWFGAASFFAWGMGVRLVISYHSTWFVNSATHLWGYRNYETRDASRNLWWVAMLSYGEGWHNNHHAHPSVAPAGHKWWEIDMTWWAIKFLRMTGMATDVKDQLPKASAPTTE